MGQTLFEKNRQSSFPQSRYLPAASPEPPFWSLRNCPGGEASLNFPKPLATGQRVLGPSTEHIKELLWASDGQALLRPGVGAWVRKPGLWGSCSLGFWKQVLSPGKLEHQASPPQAEPALPPSAYKQQGRLTAVVILWLEGRLSTFPGECN